MIILSVNSYFFSLCNYTIFSDFFSSSGPSDPLRCSAYTHLYTHSMTMITVTLKLCFFFSVGVLVEQFPQHSPLLLLALPLVQLLSLPRPPGARPRDLTLANQKTAHLLLESVEKCNNTQWKETEEVRTYNTDVHVCKKTLTIFFVLFGLFL